MSSYNILVSLEMMEQKLNLMLANLRVQGELLERLVELAEAKNLTPEEMSTVITRLRGSATKLRSMQNDPASTH